MQPKSCSNQNANKGWRIIPLAAQNAAGGLLKCKGLYNVKVENNSDVPLIIGGYTVRPGQCLALGIEGFPCLEDISYTWNGENEDDQNKRKEINAIGFILEECC